MSRNGSGTYSLPAGNPVVTGTTISSTWANTTLSDIASALTGSVASDGQTPMTGNLQMGSNKITGLAAGTSSTDAATYGQITGGTEAGVFTNVTDSGLTSGRVVYATTGGLLTSSANLLYSGTDLTVYGITVGRGGGADTYSTAVGVSALASNTSSYNTAVGWNALTANTSGSSNSAFGLGALKGNTAGASNSAFGVNSMQSNTTGGSNTAIGQLALQANTTASYNTALGYQAGYSSVTADGGTFVGYQAGRVTTAEYNTFIGYSSGVVNTTGTRNTGLGTVSLPSNTTGSYNTALGFHALQANTTANYNTAVGYQAGYSNATGSYNTFVGRKAGYATTSGENTFIGQGSGAANTTGTLNSALGSDSFATNTTGSYNTAIGNLALAANTTASNNTAVGYQAGYSTTTSGLNTFVGYQAGYTATGAYNTIVGSRSGTASSFSGAQNTFVGDSSGNSATTGQLNTFVGQNAGNLVTTGNSNTILGRYNGNQGGLDIRTASNYIVLSDGDGNPRGIFDGSGNLGVGRLPTGYGKISILFDPTSSSNNFTGLGIDPTASTSGAKFVQFYNELGSGIGSISRNGTSNAILYNTSSDYRLKENVQPLTGALARVSALKPVQWVWKDCNGETGEGFIAHEVQEVISGAVSGEKDAVDANGKPQYQGMDSSYLVATLTAAIQELKAEVDSLKQQLNNGV